MDGKTIRRYEKSVVHMFLTSVLDDVCCLTEYSPLPWSKYRAAQGRRDKKGSALA